MLEALTTLGGLVAALGNVQTVGVLKERIALIQDQYALAHQETLRLTAENHRLAQELDQAKAQLAAHARAQQFVEHRGAFFKRDVSGGYGAVVYCPECQRSTAAFPPGESFNCMKCGWFSAFHEADLAAVVAGLPR